MKEMLKTIYKQIDDKQGEDIKVLNVGEITSIAEYFVIASADNERKVRAIANAVEDELAKAGIEPKLKEGIQASNWILLDYADIIVHIFKDEERDYYKIEKIWKDAVDLTEEIKAAL